VNTKTKKRRETVVTLPHHTAEDYVLLFGDLQGIGVAVSELVEKEQQWVDPDRIGESTPLAEALRGLADAFVVANNAMHLQCERDTAGRPAHTIFEPEAEVTPSK
jgi:hypothetical protein